MCLNHNLITEGELDTEEFRWGHRRQPLWHSLKHCAQSVCLRKQRAGSLYEASWYVVSATALSLSFRQPFANVVVVCRLCAWSTGLPRSCVALLMLRRYQGPSPDEVALVEGARQLGFEFRGRTRTHATISFLGQEVCNRVVAN